MAANRPTIDLNALPANIKALVERGQNAVRMNNHEYAVQIMQAILKDFPDYLDGRRLARKAAAVKKATSGKKLLDTSSLALMKIRPKVKKEPEVAMLELEGFLATDPHHQEANILLFEAADALGMIDTAAFALETVREAYPTNTKMHHKLAAYYLANALPDRAARVYEGILKVDPSDGEARKGFTNSNAKHTMDRTKVGQGSVNAFVKDKAGAEKSELLEKQALSPEQAEKLLEYLNIDYAANQEDINTVRKIAETYEKMERFHEALPYYEYALSRNTGDTSLERKVQKLRDKLIEMHHAELRGWLDENPDHPEAPAQREVLADLEKQRALANLAMAKEAVERNPTEHQLRYEYGLQLYAAGMPGEAIPELQKAKANPGIRTKAMLVLSSCFVARNMTDMAARQLEELIKECLVLDATKIAALYDIGHIYRSQNREAEALNAWKQIYEVDYHYRDVAQLVESSYAG